MKSFKIAMLSFLIGCSSSDQPKLESALPDCSKVSCYSEPLFKTFKGQDWELTLPSEGWAEGDKTEAGLQLVAINANLKQLITVSSEAFEGSSDKYAILALRGLKANKAKLIKSSSIDSNGIRFVSAISEKEETRMYLWTTVKNKKAFTMFCGGPKEDTSLQSVCETAFAKFKI